MQSENSKETTILSSIRKKESKGFWVGLTALVIVLGAGWGLLSREPMTVTVWGEGEVSVKPEYVTLVASRVNVSTDIERGIKDGENAINSLADLATKQAGADALIKRSFYQITPQTNGNYVIGNAFSIKSYNVAGVNKLIADLYANGATMISNVSFGAEDEIEAEEQARNKALEDSKLRGQRVARAAGKRLGRVVSVSDEDLTNSSSVSGDRADSGNLSSISVTKRLMVVYEVK